MTATATRKTYVLDTSVLLTAGASALTAFAEHDVVLPLAVVTELEGKRNDPELGWIAREVLRALEDYRTSAAASGANSRAPYTVTPEGGTLRVELNHVDQSALPDALIKHANGQKRTENDVRILAVANNLQRQHSDQDDPDGVGNPVRQVILVSRDLPMRFIAGNALGLIAEDYRNDQAPDNGYTGIREVRAIVDSIYDQGSSTYLPAAEDAPINTGIVLPGALATVIGPRGKIARIEPADNVYGLKPHTAEQRIAANHLLNPDITIVSLGGRAGTGKTALALAAGLEQVIEQRRYNKIVVFRPMYAVGGQDLGYLPGTAEEKTAPWAAAIHDALSAFCSKNDLEHIELHNLIEILPLTHIRGRSLHNSFVILDEAQNCERPVLLSALSRIGQNSKVVLTHDVAQRDNLRVGRHDGIATVVDRLVGEPLFAHVTLTKTERSATAEMVARLLDRD